MSSIRLGVTLYSFNAEFHSNKYSFEDCMALVGSLGAGQGVELVGPQMIRGFPQLSPEFEHRFKHAVERHDLRPTAYGGYGDAQRISGRWATPDEQARYLQQQVRAAARLGFPVIRLQSSEAVLTDLVPYAEQHGVKIGLEIHSPHRIEDLGPLIERVEQIDSPYLGFIPDCGAFCHSCAGVYVQRFLELGVSQQIVDAILGLWEERATEDAMHAAVDRLGGDHYAHLMALEANIYFGHSEPQALRAIMPRIVHLHGKFFDITDDGKDSAVRFPEVLEALIDGGYDGYISCEYEGHHWYPERDALGQIKTLQRYIDGRIGAGGGDVALTEV